MSTNTNITVCVHIYKNSYICMYTHKQSLLHFFKCCMLLKITMIRKAYESKFH